MMKNKILSYLLLLGFTLIASILLMFVFVFIFSSREKGIAWGICAGIIVGQIALSIFQKQKVISIIFSTIIYALLVFICLYGVTNFMKPLFQLGKFILYALSFIVCWEISLYITNKISKSLKHESHS